MRCPTWRRLTPFIQSSFRLQKNLLTTKCFINEGCTIRGARASSVCYMYIYIYIYIYYIYLKVSISIITIAVQGGVVTLQ